jgi:hypothetical protein
VGNSAFGMAGKGMRTIDVIYDADLHFLASGPPSGLLRYAAFGGLLTTLGFPHATLALGHGRIDGEQHSIATDGIRRGESKAARPGVNDTNSAWSAAVLRLTV